VYPGERFNSITHIIGTVLALIGSVVAVTMVFSADAMRRPSPPSLFTA
jgi:predicted membrane channel-forming protein YqfA (hemolysin III family)